MPRAKKVTKDKAFYGLTIKCPACDDLHVLHGWNWNGDLELPTLTPSLPVTHKTVEEGKTVHYVCHSYITNGQIQYLSDCTHKMAGQTVDLPEIE
jgi:hypothetical protein